MALYIRPGHENEDTNWLLGDKHHKQKDAGHRA